LPSFSGLITPIGVINIESRLPVKANGYRSV
jgi:hypothetical protein